MKPDDNFPPLPEWRHLPGVNNRHPESAFDEIKRRCTPLVSEGNVQSNITWKYGIRLFNEQYYWETHELLEEVWARTLHNSMERYLVQCIIHLANGGLKAALGRENAARRLADMAEICGQSAYGGKRRLVMGVIRDDIDESCWRLRRNQPPKRITLHEQDSA